MMISEMTGEDFVEAANREILWALRISNGLAIDSQANGFFGCRDFTFRSDVHV